MRSWVKRVEKDRNMWYNDSKNKRYRNGTDSSKMSDMRKPRCGKIREREMWTPKI
jgi:hypothetical protein